MTVVVDASAILSVLKDEDDAARFKKAFYDTPDLRITVVNAWEVMAKYVPPRGPAAQADVEGYFRDIRLKVEPITIELYLRAVEAQLRFGWSTPAKLNMGDCFAYALASSLDAPILFKGKDFPLTDLRIAG